MANIVSTDIKIHKSVVDRILTGRTPGNNLPKILMDMGDKIIAAVRQNVLSAPNHPNGIRQNRDLSGSPGRYFSGQLLNSYKKTYIQNGMNGQPEVRVGSDLKTDDGISLALLHEEGTDKTGWGRGILPGNMLRDAAKSVSGYRSRLRKMK